MLRPPIPSWSMRDRVQGDGLIPDKTGSGNDRVTADSRISLRKLTEEEIYALLEHLTKADDSLMLGWHSHWMRKGLQLAQLWTTELVALTAQLERGRAPLCPLPSLQVSSA